MGSSVKEEFGALDESLLSKILNFIHPNERYLFTGQGEPGKEELSKEGFKFELIAKEFELAGDDLSSFYGRIELLTNLGSSLDKFLTESNDQRYVRFIDASFYNDFRSNFAKAVVNPLSGLRRGFDAYRSATLYNYGSILRTYNRLNRLRECRPFLEIYREMLSISEYSRRLDVPVANRMLACAWGIKYAREAAEGDPKVAKTSFFSVLRDQLSRNLDKLLTNIFVKNQYRYDPSDKLLILMLLGQSREQSCNYIIGFLREELLSVASLTIQKYLTMEKDFSGMRFSGMGRRDIGAQASMVSPDLALLVVCKILSEFVTFFQNLTAKLKCESKVVAPDHFKNNLTGSSRLDSLLNSLGSADYFLYYRKSLDLFVAKFGVMVDASLCVLANLVSGLNLKEVKDRNDVLKIALLILYYLTIQEGLKGSGPEDLVDCSCNNGGLDGELADLLNRHCLAILKTYENCAHGEVDGARVNLERALSVPLNDYAESYALETRENMAISFRDDTFQRVMVHPVSLKGAQLELYIRTFKTFISGGDFVSLGNFRFSALNPYLGWTPNSNFVTINLGAPLFQNCNIGGGGRMKPSGVDLLDSRLVRDYGGVYTVTSRMMLRTFEHYYKLMLLQPRNSTNLIRTYAKLLDEFIYTNVQSCRIDGSVIGSLKKFNRVLNTPEMEEERYTSISTCDTFRPETALEQGESALSRLTIIVNVVESCFTLVQHLAASVALNEAKYTEFGSYLTEYHNERIEVIRELRMILYHVAMYDVLRPKLPSIKLNRAMRESRPLHISTDVNMAFRDFQRHLGSLREFMESDHSAQFPVVVKLFLWDSIINVEKDTFKPILSLFAKGAESELGRSISKNYSDLLGLTFQVRAQYLGRIRDDLKTHENEVANLGTYYDSIKGLFCSAL